MAVETMIDVETLGTSPGSAILSLGGLCFDPRKPWDPILGQIEASDRFLVKVDLQSCIDVGLFMEVEAVKFWMGQPDAARQEAFSGETPLAEALAGLTGWFLSTGAEKVWAHGAPFDPVLLDAAYRAVGLEAPWQFRDVRDTRTAYDMAGIRYAGKGHMALADCEAQAEKVSEAYGILGIRDLAE